MCQDKMGLIFRIGVKSQPRNMCSLPRNTLVKKNVDWCFLSAVWLPHGQHWVIMGQPHSLDVNHCVIMKVWPKENLEPPSETCSFSSFKRTVGCEREIIRYDHSDLAYQATLPTLAHFEKVLPYNYGFQTVCFIAFIVSFFTEQCLIQSHQVYLKSKCSKLTIQALEEGL